MEKKIIVNKLKGIENLEFTVPNKPGVYLLVGMNGSGKTSILTCLERIKNPNAFARGFINANSVNHVDSYLGAKITYDIKSAGGNINVSFTKMKEKWMPKPKKNGKIVLNKFGFSDVVFIRADSKRIEAKKEDLKPGKFVSADKEIRETMNTLFDTKKYNQLQVLKISNGRGKQSSSFYVIKDSENTYYSEKRFSTGELAILRLVEHISVTQNNAMILLDEAEMALHPRVQINLLSYLKTKAEEHNLIIFLATHSSTLISSSDKNNIMLLRSNKNNYYIETPCYPSLAIGTVDYAVNKFFDVIYFVEDDMARELLKKEIGRYISEYPEKKYSALSYSIVPVGGFVETADFAVRTNKQLFNRSKVYAVLDDDAFTEGIKVREDFKKLYNDNKDKIYSLGVTPELWIVDNIESKDRNEINEEMAKLFNCELTTILQDKNYKKVHTGNPRKDAKAKFKIIMGYAKDYSGDSEEIILDRILDLLNKSFSKEFIGKTIGPLLNSI